MKQLSRHIAWTTFVSVVGSMTMTAIIMKIAMGNVVPIGLFISFIVPATVYPVVSLRIQRNRNQLKAALDDLALAHAELERLNQELERQAQQDFVTGVFNRRHFVQLLGEAEKSTAKGVLLCIDADNFKRINDSYGHKAGDEALVALTKSICAVTRDSDIVARVGGEEFAVFLPNANYEDAKFIAERIRANVEETNFFPIPGKRHQMTVSIGSAFAVEEEDFDILVDQADKRMYEAKQNGKNCVVFPERDELPDAA